MNKTIVFAIFMTGCGLGVHGYSSRYSTPVYGGRAGAQAEESYSGTDIAVPVSPANVMGCTRSLQLAIRNPSHEFDVVVHPGRQIDDGTTMDTAVAVPRGGTRVICLPDIGDYEFQVEYYAFSHGAPRLMGCSVERESYSFQTDFEGRHGFRVYPRPDNSC